MIKKLIALSLGLCLLLSLAQASEPASYFFEGKVSAGQERPLKAPMSGSISNLFSKSSLAVKKGEPILEISPEVAASPINGVVGSIIAKVGDNLDSMKEIYKASMYVDREFQGIAKCTHVHAAKPYEYKVAVLGEKVYLQNRTDITQVGEGEVIARDEKSFTVKMTSGAIRYGSKIYVYRSPGFEHSKRLGGGKLTRENPFPVNAEGVMVELLVKSGDKVKAGDPLFRYTKKVSMDSDGPILKMPADGIITKLDKKLSDKVEADEVVGTYILNDEKFITAKVSELEANSLKIGDKLKGYAISVEQKEIICTVLGIAAIPDDKGLYEVRLTADEVADLRIGTTLNFSSGTEKR